MVRPNLIGAGRDRRGAGTHPAPEPVSTHRHCTRGTDTAMTGTLRFIGNATVLIEHAGFTILTDPNFLHRGEKADLGYGLRTTRLTDPAMEIDELPALDLVVLSHLHGDHFDQVAEERLDHAVPIRRAADGRRGADGEGIPARHPARHVGDASASRRRCWSRRCRASTRRARSRSRCPTSWAA
ncbi:MAG TPA: MBL fold metallo-hydrolase [Candidatus Limnocylindria bacterium]|nr:MBL fold metallo-hydrolase [Candidatus Limnocylindria bacterium]